MGRCDSQQPHEGPPPCGQPSRCDVRQGTLSPCPYLPEAKPKMSYRCLRTPEVLAQVELFYLTALQYSQHLWQQGHAGRSILALARALYCNIPHDAAILKQWPLPYAALQWIVRWHHCDDFPGNPRLSFQHQASRLRGDREVLRRARAWAAWALVCQARPSLKGDPAEPTPEPSAPQVRELLVQYGHKNEPYLWDQARLTMLVASC